MAKQLTVSDVKSRIAARIAGAINNDRKRSQLAKSVTQYAAFTGMSATSLQERAKVVDQVIEDFPYLFPGL